jgi:ectoine hydroxylase-related dioxygenase (phytanoyl-CoA dioxygenase family)
MDLVREDAPLPATSHGQPVESLPRPVAAGHVHYHHCLTWHASFPNRSKRPRRAIGYHFMPEEPVYVEAGNHIMKPPITVADGERLAGAAFPQTFPIS